MATFVGLQDDFFEALSQLLELEYDALEAYKTAIEKLDDDGFKKVILSFSKDHSRHIQDISDFLKAQEKDAPTGPDNTKSWLTKGKVYLANLVGDKSIISAMSSNEVDTNTAYERICSREDIPEEARKFLSKAYEDEKRHKDWLDHNKL